MTTDPARRPPALHWHYEDPNHPGRCGYCGQPYVNAARSVIPPVSARPFPGLRQSLLEAGRAANLAVGGTAQPPRRWTPRGRKLERAVFQLIYVAMGAGAALVVYPVLRGDELTAALATVGLIGALVVHVVWTWRYP